jgi:triosephosphate isomerase
METRQKYVAGNWKMNLTFEKGKELSIAIVDTMVASPTVVILCPPFVHLRTTNNLIKDVHNLKLGAQNCSHEANGAYTGEVSAPMLTSVGCEYVIIGHSERREYFSETDELLSLKVRTSLKSGLKPIFCCGEKLLERENNLQKKVVEQQLITGLFEHLSETEFSKVIISYEPVWAIGTGKNATPAQAQEMHAFIRSLVAKRYNKKLAEATPIIYGGSCKAANARDLFAQKDVDGGLIGGASLNAVEFVEIVKASF